jgi:teichuronic acid biosynthesis glycosyltransferase TuaG
LKKPDLVSIVTPVHNAGSFIAQTIDSVIAQSYSNWELLLINDRSTDNSVDIIEHYTSSDQRISRFELDNGYGPAKARNYGIRHAKGRYIAFLDADDEWLPEKLEKQVRFLQENHLPFTFSSYEQMDETGNFLGVQIVPEKISYNQLLKTNMVGCLTAIYDSQMVGKLYMPDILKRQDYGLWLEIARIYGHLQSTSPEMPLARYRIRQDSVSSNKTSLIKYNWVLLRKHQKLGLIQSLFFLSLQIWNKLTR